MWKPNSRCRRFTAGWSSKNCRRPTVRRPEGSFSKLNTVSDGFRVILRLFLIMKSYKPLTFFGIGSLVLLILGLVVGSRPVYEYITERYVHAVPSAMLAASLVMLAFFSLGLGLILNSVNLRLLELEKLVGKRLDSDRDPKPPPEESSLS